ncbi:MAG TPA: SpoIIE family protein phosphatase [Candidatus Polarisedimenticolaceae bacterium]
MPVRSRRLVLALLAAISVAVQLRVSWDVWSLATRDGDPARRPFSILTATGRIVAPEDEALAAGLREGDRPTEIAGRPFRGTADLSAPVRAASPGDSLRVVVEREATVAAADVRLAADTLARTPGAEVVLWVLRFVMPWLSLSLGFWVAFARPHDRRAWLLLFLMATFTDPFGRGVYAHWEPGLRELGQLWGALAGSCWPIAMMLFGTFFPERIGIDRRFPWPRRIATLLLGTHAALRALSAVLAPAWIDAAAVPARLYTGVAVPVFVLGMAAVSWFFMSQGIRHATPMPPDVRRRLILLQVGTTAALLPGFGLVIASLVTGRDFESLAPPWVLFPAFLATVLFPLTLAYVVVVERALDVRVVIREGLQYAFARRGIFALRVVLIAGTAGFTFWRIATRPDMRRVDVVGALAVGALLVVLLKRFGDATLRWTDRRFFREAVDAERVLGALAEEVRTVVDRDALVDVIVRRLRESLHVERVAVLLRGEPGFPAGLQDLRKPVRVKRGADPALDALGAEVVVPLPARDHLNGVLVLGARRAEAPYSAADLRLLESVGDRAGVALENARLTAAVAAEAAQRGRLTREVEIAREVQQRLFPQALPKVAGLELAGYCRTALGVGGDYYDFLVLPDGSLLFAIGDVSGKGIGAALVMASLQASLRGQSIRASGDLAQLMETVSALVHDATPENRYATLFVGRYEPKARRLVYVNGGHNAPVLLRANGEVERLAATGMVVGLMEGTRFVEAETALGPGDLLCGFSDGISEAMTGDDEEFGEERLLAALRGADGASPREVIDRLFAATDAFTAGAAQHDDMTVVVLMGTATFFPNPEAPVAGLGK